MALIATHPHPHSFSPSGTAASGAAVAAGITSGLLGGLAMGLVAMLHAASLGQDLWQPLRLIAAALYGRGALVGGMNVVWAGLILHLVVSAVLGLLFGMVVGRRWETGPAFGLGLVWGAAVWAAMTFIVLPIVNPIMRVSVAQMPGIWFTLHLIFGAFFFLSPALSALFSGQPREDRVADFDAAARPR